MRGCGAAASGPPNTIPAPAGVGAMWPALIGMGSTGLRWRAWVKYGDVVPGVVAVQAAGAKAIHVLVGGKQLFVECIRGIATESLLRRAGGYDARIVAM